MPNDLPPPAVVRAGCAQQIITPPLGVSLAGYFHNRVAKSVRDDLFARALVAERAGVRAALIGCDIVCITKDVAGPAKEMVRSECGIPWKLWDVS